MRVALCGARGRIPGEKAGQRQRSHPHMRRIDELFMAYILFMVRGGLTLQLRSERHDINRASACSG